MRPTSPIPPRPTYPTTPRPFPGVPPVRPSRVW